MRSLFILATISVTLHWTARAQTAPDEVKDAEGKRHEITQDEILKALSKPRIEVFKGKRELQLFDGDRLIKTYRVALGTNPVPPKERQGDRATPEGAYFICHKNPESQYHLSLAISYPGPADAKRGLKSGLISKQESKAIIQADANRKTPPWDTKLGGEVFVHGKGSTPDWTLGCIALDDPDIEELYRLVPTKTRITINP